MTRKRALGILLVVAFAIAAFFVVRSRDNDSNDTDGQTFEVGNNKLTVDADITDGEVVVEPSRGGEPDIPGITPLAQPVHLDVEGGSLRSATITFQVDTSKLPEDTDPEAVLSILTRGEKTDNQWIWAGPGDYNAAARTLSIETTHFSDWTFGMTDFDEIARQIERSERDSLGSKIARGMWGDIPPLTCPDTEIPLTFAISSEVDPPVDTCITYNPEERRYRIEITNQTPLPFALTVPEGYRVVSEDVEEVVGDNVVADAYVDALYALASEKSLPPEEKVIITASQDAFINGDKITLVFDQMAFAGNMSARYTGVDLSVFVNGDDSRYSALKGQTQELLSDEEVARCVRNLTDTMFEDMADGSLDMQVIVDAIAERCLLPALKDRAENWAERNLGFIVKPYRYIKKRYDTIKDIPETLAFVRQETVGLLTLYAEHRGWVDSAGAEITYVPDPPLNRLHQILPAPPDSQPDSRVLTEIGLHMLLPDGCGEFEYPWFAASRNVPGAAVTATSSYTVDGMRVNTFLFKAAAGQREAVASYVPSMPDTCIGKYGAGDYERHYTRINTFWTDVWRGYSRTVLSDPATWGYDYVLSSGDYLLYVAFDGEGTAPANDQAARDEVTRIAEHLDLYLPTSFQP